jgi:hypothetical protein
MMIFLSFLVHSPICFAFNLSFSNAILLKPDFLGETRSAGMPFRLLRCFSKPRRLCISFSELAVPLNI